MRPASTCRHHLLFICFVGRTCNVGRDFAARVCQGIGVGLGRGHGSSGVGGVRRSGRIVGSHQRSGGGRQSAGADLGDLDRPDSRLGIEPADVGRQPDQRLRPFPRSGLCRQPDVRLQHAPEDRRDSGNRRGARCQLGQHHRLGRREAVADLLGEARRQPEVGRIGQAAADGGPSVHRNRSGCQAGRRT